VGEVSDQNMERNAEILRLRAEGKKVGELAAMFSVSSTTIQSVCKMHNKRNSPLFVEVKSLEAKVDRLRRELRETMASLQQKREELRSVKQSSKIKKPADPK
jgi:hypothetical protein